MTGMSVNRIDWMVNNPAARGEYGLSVLCCSSHLIAWREWRPPLDCLLE